MTESLRITRRNRRWFRVLLLLASYSSRKTRIHVARGSRLLARKVEVGYGSRINGPALAKGAGDLTIGRYCAIGHDVRFITSNHSVRTMNLNLALQVSVGASRHVASGEGIQIGHNVWIGDCVIILPGVSVGNGAIIGAGAVVAKSVGAYEVVVGNPARPIRRRVSDEVVEILESSRWWELPESRLAGVREAFEIADVDAQSAHLRNLLDSLHTRT